MKLKQNWTSELEYVSVRIPDKMLIASIINEAKGCRTMAQLAELCGISASTLSRAVNGKITKPMPVELIKKIAENAEPKDSQLFERLVRANGLMPKNEFEMRNARISARNHSIIEERRILETKAKNIIMNELFNRGIFVKLLPRGGATLHSSYGQALPFDFAIETDLGNGKIIWSFLIIPYTLSEVLGEGNIPVGYYLRRAMQNMSGWFLTDAWEPEILKNRLHSFLFVDGSVYLSFEDHLVGGPQLNSDISFITINVVEEKIDFEIFMEKKDKPKCDLIFARPLVAVEENGNSDENWKVSEGEDVYIAAQVLEGEFS